MKITGDVAPWTLAGEPAIVFGCDDTARSGFLSEHQNPRNDLNGRSKSNLWFTTWESLEQLGRPAGMGYVWRGEDVKAGVASDPFLLAGDYGWRVVHLAHGGDAPVSYTLSAGAGDDWKPVAQVTVPARGHAFHVLPTDVAGEWVRRCFGCRSRSIPRRQPRMKDRLPPAGRAASGKCPRSGAC